MALTDLTGIYRNKEFKGGVGGGANPVAFYDGPEPLDGEDVSAETLKASVMGIYEKYGRSAKGIRMAKASPEYAALQGAGISVFGTPTAKIGPDGKLTGGTTTLSGASEEAKAKAASQYAALSGGSRRSRTPSSSLANVVSTGSEVTTPAPAQSKPRVPESTAQTAQSTSMDSVNPTASAPSTTTEIPKVEPSQTPKKETSKGQRLDTSREQAPAEVPSNAGTFKGGQEARTAADAKRAEAMSPKAQMERVNAIRKADGMDEIDFAGQEPKMDQGGINDTIKRQEAAGVAMSRTTDAAEKMALARERNRAQEDREGIKKKYNEESQQLDFERRRNEKVFGNPYGPDKGESRRLNEAPPELAPLGGYQKYGSNAGRAIGPMTNAPASSEAEYNERLAKFSEAGVQQQSDNFEAKRRKSQEAQSKYVEKLNEKYAGPGPFPRKA